MNPASFTARNQNARQIMEYILQHGEASRVMLANVLGLSRSTVTVIVADLIEQKLLYESHPGQSQVGRRSTMLRFNADWAYLLSVELGNDNDGVARFHICNLEGTVISGVEEPFNLKVSKNQSTTAVLRQLIYAIQNFLNRHPPKIREQIRACGLCVAGSVDRHQIVDMAYFDWDLANVLPPLQAALEFPVFLEGVTRIKATYEMRFIDPTERNVIYLNMTDGIGMVNFFKGKMITGQIGLAGEIGHICLNKEGPSCYCGGVGCFEYYCGMAQRLQRLSAHISDLPHSDPLYRMISKEAMPLNAETLFSAMECGSLAVHEQFEEMTEYLGIGLSTILNIYDPDRIILTGYLNGKDTFLIESAIRKAKNHVCRRDARNNQITRAHLPHNQTHLAISAYVLSRMLDNLFPT